MSDYITPVMYIDSTGQAWWNPFSWSNEAKIVAGAVIIVALAIATVATGGAAGGVAGFILSGALKGAVIGAVSGGLISGTIGGISSGSWEGFYSGFADGFMTGAFIGGVTGAASNAFKVAKAASMWDKGTFPSKWASMADHYQRHVVSRGFQVGNNVIKYTDDAVGFMSRNGNAFSMLRGGEGLQHVWTLSRNFGSGANGLYTSLGKIITYNYWFIP